MARGDETYFEVLTAAVAELAEHGYDNAERVAYWTHRLRDIANATLTPLPEMERLLRETLASVYKTMVDNGGISKYHFGVSRFTIEQLKPQLRAELDRRILAAADLIRLNREEAIRKTLHRFQGWAISIPKGGSEAVDKRAEKAAIKKPLTRLSFEDRRCFIDQGQKLAASISDIIAVDGGAIAGEWHSRYREANYNYREDHKERDGNFYLIRGNWAQEKGFVKAGPAGYTDEITKPAEEVFCRCKYRYVHNLRDLPKDMLTRKGAEALAAVRQTA